MVNTQYIIHIISGLVFLSLSCAGQQNFLSGYIVTTQGDTVRGLIEYRQWNNSPSEVVFKEHIQGEAKTLRPKDLYYFYIEKPNELYRALSTDIMMRPNKSGMQATNEKRRYTGFAHVLVLGEVSLYMVKVEDMPYYFLGFSDGRLQELILRRQLVGLPSGAATYRDYPVYQDFLNSLETDCPALAGQAKKMRFSDKDFIAFVTKYNNCTSGTQAEVRPLGKKLAKRFGVVLTLGQEDYNFSVYYPDLDNGSLTTYSLGLGGAMMAYLPRGQGRWAYYFDVYYKRVRAENTARFFKAFAHYESQNTFNFDLLKSTAQFRHTSVSGRVRPYLSGGVTATLTQFTKVTANYHNLNTNERETQHYKLKNEFGYLFEGGIQVQNAEVGFRWERLFYNRTIFSESQFLNVVAKYYLSRKN